MTERSHRSNLLPPTEIVSPWWLTLAIVAVLLLAYANSFPGAFFFDDDAAILQNASIRDLSAIKNVLWPPLEAGIGGRPFANLTFALNYAASGYQPWSYHATNLAIHIAGAVLLFALTRHTLQRPALRERFGRNATPVAAVVALLWALHPLETNITDYVSQRTEGLMGALYLLALYAFVLSIALESAAWRVTMIVAGVLGMMTKEGMATLPAMALLYDRTFIAGSFRAALREHWREYLGLAAGWVVLAVLVATSKLSARGVGFGLGLSWYEYALTECRSIVRYLQLSWWPHPLVFDYGPDYIRHLEAAWPSALVLSGTIGATLYALWRAPWLGFLGAWFFVVLSPSSSVIPVVQQPCAENRVYLPLVAAAALTAIVGYRLGGRGALTALLLSVGALGVLTATRNRVFASEVTVWWDTVAKRPLNERAENNLGNALLKLNRNAEALPHIETAIRLSPHYADAHNNRGVVLLRLGRPTEAVEEFLAAVKAKPTYADAHYNLGDAYLQLGRPADAIKTLETSLKFEPRNPKAHNNLGIALLDTGHVPESIAEERRALELDPDMPEAHYNLGNSLAKAGQVESALEEYETTLRLDPTFAKAHNNAGVLLLQAGRLVEAAARFEAALRIRPDYPEAKRNLEVVRTRQPS